LESKLLSDLKKMGADIDAIKECNPTERQLQDLRKGLSTLLKEAYSAEK
jgi:hypothetical protein